MNQPIKHIITFLLLALYLLPAVGVRVIEHSCDVCHEDEIYLFDDTACCSGISCHEEHSEEHCHHDCSHEVSYYKLNLPTIVYENSIDFSSYNLIVIILTTFVVDFQDHVQDYITYIESPPDKLFGKYLLYFIERLIL